MRFTKLLIFAVFCTLLLIAGCSTTNHAPLPSMVYQDITGHYNSYFNTKEKMKGVYASMDKIHKDNYKEILPLFTYSNPKEATSVTADLEDIEKRCTLSVQIHKVSNWNDDHFLLMGKANFIKGNYDKAQAFFKYTTTQFKNGVDYVKEMKKLGKVAKPTVKKKPPVKPKFVQVLDTTGNLLLKKVDQRPSYTLMIHEPARAEALVWLAKTYSVQHKYAEASAVIQYMRSDDKFYTNLDKDVELVEAENFLNQKNYNDAIKPLEKYISMAKKKSQRLRPIFILAQIYEMKGDYVKASDYYKQVLSNGPSYEMEFYAKIKRAKLGKRSGSSEEIKQLLIAMSHDGKYKDYLDQIYYELGQIVLGENNRAEARKDFHKSILNSTKNSDQKALAYLQLARMDYEEEYYVTSKLYYDSTSQNLSKTDTAYEAVQSRDNTLGKLVKQINIITTEDSLQRIANMSASERSKFLNKLLDAKQREADEKQSEKEKSKTANTDFIKNGPGAGGPPPPSEDVSSFYFYNVAARSNGYSEFLKKWGSRKLEENWRRKDKSATLTENIEESDSAKAKKAAKDSTTFIPGSEEEKLMAGLPMTPEKMEKSNAKLVEAYYLLGSVYKDDLQSFRKAILAFEELNKRFPISKLELESSYQLYLLHERAKNTNKSDYYKNLILTDYPNSTIARYIKDPKYLEEVKKKENSLSFYYESAYNDYATGMYASAEQKCRDVDVQFKENKMRAKFDILNAMSLAKENRLSDYVESLNKIIAKYPGTSEKDQAQLWLTNLNRSKLPQVDLSKLPKDSLNAAAIASAPVVTFSDTIGRAAFLEKIKQDNKKDQAKKDAQDLLLKNLEAAKKASEDAKNAPPKDTSATAKSAKPYKPLSRRERLDSMIKAEKAAKYKTSNSSPSTKTATGIADSALSSKSVSKETSSKKGPLNKTTIKDTTSKNGAKPAAKNLTKDSLSKKTDIKEPSKNKSNTKDSTAAKPPSTLIVITKPSFDTDTLTEIYGKSDGAPHYVIIYFLDPTAYSYSVISKIDNFNSTAFESQKLSSKATVLDKDNKVMMIKSFKNKDLAEAYLTSLRAKLPEIMTGISQDLYFAGSISTLNYGTLISSKKINNYIRFYRINYK